MMLIYVDFTCTITQAVIHVHPVYILIYDVCRILRNEIGQYWLKSAKCARWLVCIACTHTHTLMSSSCLRYIYIHACDQCYHSPCCYSCCLVLYGHLSSSFLSLSHSCSAGYLQTAHSTLLHARDYSLSEFCIEHAEWKCNQVTCGWGCCIMIQPHTHTAH